MKTTLSIKRTAKIGLLLLSVSGVVSDCYASRPDTLSDDSQALVKFTHNVPRRSGESIRKEADKNTSSIYRKEGTPYESKSMGQRVFGTSTDDILKTLQDDGFEVDPRYSDKNNLKRIAKMVNEREEAIKELVDEGKLRVKKEQELQRDLVRREEVFKKEEDHYKSILKLKDALVDTNVRLVKSQDTTIAKVEETLQAYNARVIALIRLINPNLIISRSAPLHDNFTMLENIIDKLLQEATEE